MADKAPITPKVLQWARESARMSSEVAAAKVAVTPQKLTEWEEGKSQPTMTQAETLAKAYRRPFALFFLPDIPRDFLPLQDFRTKNAKQLSTASIFIIREIQQKQAWISNFFEENNEKKLPFVGKFSINDSSVKVAQDMLETLQIDRQYYKDNPIKEWINKAESKGIFISRTSFIHSRMKLDSDEFQGFAIADNFAPFVFINSDDWNAPQLFTLVHELAHIWIAKSGISNDIESELKHKDELDPIELFCNEVAANALMPLEEMNNLDSAIFNVPGALFKKAKEMGVSSYALLYRLFNLKIIVGEAYLKLRKNADDGYNLFLQKEAEKVANKKRGGPDTYLLRLNKNGRLFTQIVIDAFRGGVIEPSQASSLLNTQINKFTKFEVLLHP
jgi:Zn-dependent peptidase ImmA (M78 family)/DNA-binding XRE family transcriptional regulator